MHNIHIHIHIYIYYDAMDNQCCRDVNWRPMNVELYHDVNSFWWFTTILIWRQSCSLLSDQWDLCVQTPQTTMCFILDMLLLIRIRISSYLVIRSFWHASWNTHLNTNGANLIIWWVDGVMTRLVESVDSVWWDCVCGIYGITACDTSLSLEVNLPRRSTPTACASTSCRQGKCFVEAAVAYINLYSSAIKTEFYARHFIRE